MLKRTIFQHSHSYSLSTQQLKHNNTLICYQTMNPEHPATLFNHECPGSPNVQNVPTTKTNPQCLPLVQCTHQRQMSPTGTAYQIKVSKAPTASRKSSRMRPQQHIIHHISDKSRSTFTLMHITRARVPHAHHSCASSTNTTQLSKVRLSNSLIMCESTIQVHFTHG
jgi:hypothetical protein